MSDIEFDDKGLSKLNKMMKVTPPTGEIGVLGEKNGRSNSEKTNAEIGAKHEYGIDVPRRSWLRVPLQDNMQQYLDNSKLFDLGSAKRAVASGSLVEWTQKVMIIAETIIMDGFQSGGFGKWLPSNMANKKNHQTLVETQQLRNSITTRVK